MPVDYPASYSPIVDAYDDLCADARALTDCPDCDGEGIVPDPTRYCRETGAPEYTTCTRCHGSGTTTKEETE